MVGVETLWCRVQHWRVAKLEERKKWSAQVRMLRERVEVTRRRVAAQGKENVSGVWRRDGVDEVGASLDASHGTSCAVVSTGGFLGGVKCPQPPSLLGHRVSDLSSVPPPWTLPDTAVPCDAARGSGGLFAAFGPQ